MSREEIIGIVGGITAVCIIYVVPCVITVINSIQTKNDLLCQMAFIPVINIVTALSSIGDVVYRFFT